MNFDFDDLMIGFDVLNEKKNVGSLSLDYIEAYSSLIKKSWKSSMLSKKEYLCLIKKVAQLGACA